MESSEHNWANISETICPEMLVFGKQACILTNPIISQINILLLPYFISYYSSAFTINQFHNHDAEVYAPQRLVCPCFSNVGSRRRCLFFQRHWGANGCIGKNKKSKDYCKADLKQRILLFITIFRLAIPAFFRFTDVTELMQQSQYYINGECRNKRERRK